MRLRHADRRRPLPSGQWRGAWRSLLDFARLIALSEHLAGTFCRRHPGFLLLSLTVSLLVWAGMVYEYVYMLACLHAPLAFDQALASLTIVRLAFLMPARRGRVRWKPARCWRWARLACLPRLASALAPLMRARDLLLGGLGLVIAASQR